MKPNIFISYSRQEVGFVDDLNSRLAKEGFNVWLDYRSLIPGTLWKDQIEKGLDEAQVIVLVVSRSSIASPNVEEEWRYALNQKNKRIILAIFEATKLPAELEQFEWVDFRGRFETGIKKLTSQIESPTTGQRPAPQKGFKIPPVVWWSIAAGALISFVSLFAIWSIILPLILVPLPFRILRRNFNYFQVQAALWLLPVGIFLFNINASNSGIDFLLEVILMGIIAAVVLGLLLRSAAMQRWGKPEATRSQYTNPYQPNNPKPRPVSFFIDHAEQDQRIADDLAMVLVKYGHPKSGDMKSAEAVFVLMSTYKTDSDANPERQVVFPVLVQTVNPAPRLCKVQWIDLRRGVRNLDAIAQLLPEPAKLLEALGVRPTGTQLVLPPIISSMIYLLAVTIASVIGSFISDTFTSLMNIQDLANLHFFSRLIFTGLTIWLAYLMLHAIIGRRGWLSTVIGAITGYLVVAFFLMILGFNYDVDDSAQLLPLSFISFVIYTTGGIILGLGALTVFRTDYLHWLPWSAKSKKTT